MTTYVAEPPYLVIAILLGVSSGLSVWLAVRNRRRSGPLADTAAALLMAVLLGLAAGGFGTVAYQRLVVSNTWTYFYEVDLDTNVSAAGTVIVPIPVDETLLRDLRGAGNISWSFVDSVHGRGLRVEFLGSGSLGAFFSEFSLWGPGRITDLSLRDDTETSPPWRAWIFYEGEANTELHLRAGDWYIDRPLTPGWGMYPLEFIALSRSTASSRSTEGRSDGPAGI